MKPKKGQLIIFSSPSGCGKTTVGKALLERNRDLIRSVSCTTRKPRKDEVHSKDYFFISKKEFQDKIRKGEFAEWAVYNKNYYGTLLKTIEEGLKAGKKILFVIEVQGAEKLLEKHPNALTIFLLPPSINELRRRLIKRGKNTPEEIEKRIKRAKEEIKQVGFYQYKVTNDDLEKAIEECENIINKVK
ncbi:guanylate kinase [bacterium (Candidatus Torokbacteria) CG_4_10_14_0_2_um_filter_35_8]|uniref:Guanylate kinase n=1 Tax=Candidatus Sherwoodlollariibacterium unditelluris TaxID=1974757 RepID=A0A2G9YIQ9_9BACT|nr:MAG: guanylate kinase [Candidatus Omnitrophica bacterium CG23_combo_of_CG06-09_8_20_14_all_41_10]PIZ56601.1 MAG: guanylate kinase [bacterium (Candidatus Torokbacteria) CG_4_10_14_0_2_um_filter_35_8]